MTAAPEGSEWSAAHPGRTLPTGKTRYPFYRRLGGPQGRSGRAENLVPTGIRSRTVQPVVSRYNDWATRPTSVGIQRPIIGRLKTGKYLEGKWTWPITTLFQYLSGGNEEKCGTAIYLMTIRISLRFFYSCPEWNSSYRMPRRMQASYEMRLRCLAQQLKKHPVVPVSKSGEASVHFKY